MDILHFLVAFFPPRIRSEHTRRQELFIPLRHVPGKVVLHDLAMVIKRVPRPCRLVWHGNRVVCRYVVTIEVEVRVHVAVVPGGLHDDVRVHDRDVSLKVGRAS